MTTLLVALLALSAPAEASTLRGACSALSTHPLRDTEACICARVRPTVWTDALDSRYEPPLVDSTCFQVNRTFSEALWSSYPAERDRWQPHNGDKAWGTAWDFGYVWNPITQVLDSMESMSDISGNEVEPQPFGQETNTGLLELYHYLPVYQNNKIVGWKPELAAILDPANKKWTGIVKVDVTFDQTRDFVISFEDEDLWVLPGPFWGANSFFKPPEEQNTSTCEDSCGGVSADQSCYCDAACVDYGDCCDDYSDFCVVEPEPAGTCDGVCGGVSADQSCFCDAACVDYGDCCDDYSDFCQVAPAPSFKKPWWW